MHYAASKTMHFASSMILPYGGSGIKQFKGTAHYLAMSILKEQVLNKHHNGVILPCYA